MADLIEKTPCEGLLPVSYGQSRLTEVNAGTMTSIARRHDALDALSEALKAAHGCAWPAVGRTSGRAGKRAIWFGHNHALLVGPVPDAGLARYAALTDQSDAWAVVRLEGPAARDVLARLTPIDVRPAMFKRGHTARTLLQHLSVCVTCVGKDTYEIMAFRSMATTLVHELSQAMQGVAARDEG